MKALIYMLLVAFGLTLVGLCCACIFAPKRADLVLVIKNDCTSDGYAYVWSRCGNEPWVASADAIKFIPGQFTGIALPCGRECRIEFYVSGQHWETRSFWPEQTDRQYLEATISKELNRL